MEGSGWRGRAEEGPGLSTVLCIDFLSMMRERMKGNLDSLLLAVLAAAPAHGYEAAERLRQRSAGTFDLPEGSIYPALHRLEARGFVTSSWALAGGRRRRVYALTTKGAAALTTEQSEWRRFVHAIQAVTGGPGLAGGPIAAGGLA